MHPAPALADTAMKYYPVYLVCMLIAYAALCMVMLLSVFTDPVMPTFPLSR